MPHEIKKHGGGGANGFILNYDYLNIIAAFDSLTLKNSVILRGEFRVISKNVDNTRSFPP